MNLTLHLVVQQEREKYLPLLLLADESKEMVREYIGEGDMYTINSERGIVGIIQVTFLSSKVVELKNMALLEGYRGKGIGRKAIENIEKLYKGKGYDELIVGTANSSIDNIAFYQKAGFRMSEIRKDFFLSYPEPIVENGIQAFDMIVFRKRLSSS
ncbi:GNAT family N-acetyltransferase [Bacillus spongiae]|uniref:GNAT family N-acetyltransferase n=1 Tax=Bacillus spongiae TaxID=2683610 RepID=A0ABU8HDS2_9BACI